MATGAPGNNFNTWRPTPPERGSFPLDHFNECKEPMMKYLKCMKVTDNQNAPNCRMLAKEYLQCRMDHQLMDKSDWESLGLSTLPNIASKKVNSASKTSIAEKSKDESS